MGSEYIPARGFAGAPRLFETYGGCAQFKQTPADFLVEEVLGFEPGGGGEHEWLWIETRDQNTRYTATCVAKLFGVPARAVSWSGLKDRHSVTRQWLSVHTPGRNEPPPSIGLKEAGITLLRHARHERKLRPGTHISNRFDIRLRGYEGNPELLHERLHAIQTRGVPNYFGPQRFGREARNIDWIRTLAERGQLPRKRADKSLALSVLRAWCFNGALAHAVQTGEWNQWQPQAPIMLAGSRSFFMVEHWDESLSERLQRHDVQMGCWLPGEQSPGLEPEWRTLLRKGRVEAQPRTQVLLPLAAQLALEADAGQRSLRLQLELPAGTFATSVIRELLDTF